MATGVQNAACCSAVRAGRWIRILLVELELFCKQVSRLSKMIVKLKTAVLNGPLIPRSGCLSRLVSPKLAHEAVLAKPPYFDEASAQ